jgi:hypothetical protein
MAKPMFRLNWLHVTALGFALLAGSSLWFYFHEWPAIRDSPGIDYYPSVARRLISFSGLALFLGGLGVGLWRAAGRLLRRFLSRQRSVR